jgi:alpha-tubulin suppressor-like RCC1 family protein
VSESESEIERRPGGRRIGRRLRPTAAVLALIPLAALVAAAGPASAKTGSTNQVDHWGRFFGNHSKRDSDQLNSPTALSFRYPIKQVGSSNSSQYALLTNGTVWAWGQGTNGQLGNGHSANSFTKPVKVRFPAGVKIAFIATDAMPYDTGLAVDTQGQAWGWGINSHGQLCLGNTTTYNTPQKLPFSDVTTLAGANGHAVYDADGTVYTCGSGPYGPTTHTPVKVKNLPAGVKVTALVSGYGNDGALLANGDYYDWGTNTQGQLGTGPGKGSTSPVQVTLPGPAAQVTLGGSTPKNGQTFVMLSDGSIYAWGSGTYYQLGNGQAKNEPTPILITPPTGVTYVTLATGGATSYGITTSGDVYSWGNGNVGQIGNNKTKTASEPVKVESGQSLISTTANDVVTAAGPAGAQG